MISRLTSLTLLVANQDDALCFYTQVLGFEKRSDRLHLNGTRWLTVAPVGQEQEIALVQIETADGARSVGKQVGGHPLFVLQSDDLDHDVSALSARGVDILASPTEHIQGRAALFRDLYGNVIRLVESPRGQLPGSRPRPISNNPAIVAHPHDQENLS